MDIATLLMIIEDTERDSLNVNDTPETVKMLEHLRPELYYKREDGKVKDKGSCWQDYKGILKMAGKIPKIEGVQVVLR